MTPLSLIEGCNLPLHLPKNSHDYSTMMSAFPPHIILKWTDKLSKPIRRSRPIFKSFASIILRNGQNFLPLPNSTITLPHIAPQKSLPFLIYLYLSLSQKNIPSHLRKTPVSHRRSLERSPCCIWFHLPVMTEQSFQRFTPWKVGDKVWLEIIYFCLHYSSKKLVPKHHGLFEINQVLSPFVYCLCLPPTWKIHNVFHPNLYHETDAHWSDWASYSVKDHVTDLSEGKCREKQCLSLPTEGP